MHTVCVTYAALVCSISLFFSKKIKRVLELINSGNSFSGLKLLPGCLKPIKLHDELGCYDLE